MAQAASPPSHASVVVIGGGVMGCSTLYHLAQLGVSDAILLERNALTSGTTWHSAAQVRALRSTRSLTNLIKYSIDLYQELQTSTGQQTGWIQHGSLSIATTNDRLTHIRRQSALADMFGIDVQELNPGEAKERWPLMNADDVIGAVFSPGDGRVNPSDLCAALVKGAKAKGVQVFENTPVTGIHTSGNRVTGIKTKQGKITCDAIAVCSGLWSRSVAAMAGVQAPIWPCEHFYLLTKPVAGAEHHLPTLSDHDGHLYIRDESQGLLVGCFEPLGKAFDPAQLDEGFAFQLFDEDWDHFEPMMMNALHRLPVLETAEVRMLLNGPESFTPDGSFLLGEAGETRGLYLGAGMNSVGVATGGGAGMALAHCIVNGASPEDLHEADPTRFPQCMNSVAALTARVPEVLGKHYEISYPGRQHASARNLRRVPLHDKWLAANTHFGQFFGWERPLYFGAKTAPTPTFARPDWFETVGKEVAYAHTGAAIFDQSTFGKIRVDGPDAEAFLERMCANTMSRPAGRATYTAMLNERGGFESDLTALRLSDQTYRLYVGTAAINRDLARLQRHLEDNDRVTLSDETEAYAVLGLMGPDAPRIAREIGAGALCDLGYFRHAEIEFAGMSVIGTRLSYVGETGWEITCRAGDAPLIYDLLFEAGARPAGLFAQTSMRIEKRYLATGHELDTDLTPLEAGLEFAIDWNKPFIGRDVLARRREAGINQSIVSILLSDEAAQPLGNEPVYAGGRIVGKTTSASFGYRIGCPVALALMDLKLCNPENDMTVEIDIARTIYQGTIRLGPAFDPSGKRMRQSNSG